MADWVFRLREKIGQEMIITPAAGGWIEDDEGRLLLQQRDQKGKKWGFPGGIIDLGESVEEAAIREVYEETGLRVRATEMIGIYSKYFVMHPNGDVCQSIATMFKMETIGGELKVDNVETFGLKYFDKSELPKLYHPQHEDILKDGLEGNWPVFR